MVAASTQNSASGRKVVVGLITAFSLVSPAFMAIHAAYRPNAMPAGVETIAAWLLAIGGMIGPLLTIGAVVLAAVALARIPLGPATKFFIIGIAILSVVCTIAMHSVSP